MVKILALGANKPSEWGNSAQTLSHAIGLLSERIGPPISRGRFYETPAFPAGSGPTYVNTAIVVSGNLQPDQLLAMCHQVEAAAERDRTQRWGARTLDIDLIADDHKVCPDAATYQFWHDLPLADQMTRAPDQLILPHPRLQDRSFVLIPMMDVAPDWRHPVLDLTTRQMLDRRPTAEKQAITLLE